MGLETGLHGMPEGELSCADSPEHRFLADHVVDNRILMPAVSFVVTAWHAAAEAAGVPPHAFPAAIEDFHVHQAVVAQKGQKVTLGVQMTADRHFHVSRSRWHPLVCWNSSRAVGALQIAEGPKGYAGRPDACESQPLAPL